MSPSGSSNHLLWWLPAAFYSHDLLMIAQGEGVGVEQSQGAHQPCVRTVESDISKEISLLYFLLCWETLDFSVLARLTAGKLRDVPGFLFSRARGEASSFTFLSNLPFHLLSPNALTPFLFLRTFLCGLSLCVSASVSVARSQWLHLPPSSLRLAPAEPASLVPFITTLTNSSRA